MISEDAQKNQFALHYHKLDLHDRADWSTARSSYRKLVHIWHPDKFANRPRERAHAQQQFIELTKSYNALRDFYRKNKRLPFQSLHVASEPQEKVQDTRKPNDASTIDDASLDSSLLSRDPSQRSIDPKKHGKRRKTWWLMVGIFTMLATIVFFLVLDQILNWTNAEKAREVIENAPQSEFMPIPSEIRKSRSRDAFIKPTR